MQVVQALTQTQLEDFCCVPGSYPLNPALPSMQQADAHWLVFGANAQPLARCSLWWQNVPTYGAERLGLIGHYAAHEADAAQCLLAQACAHLAEQGCTLAIGPLDGNTFRHYRLLTERVVDGRHHPPFFLEPDTPDDWPGHWRQAGFQSFAQYVSAIGELPAEDSRTASLAQRVADHGILIRTVDLAEFEAELHRIYGVVLQSFRNNFLYTPIAAAEFMAQYAPIRNYIQPSLVLLAEQAGEPVGFIFALPDLAQAQRGEPLDTVIIKTVGVVPELGGMGVGGLLVARCQQAARALGYRYAIHALMVEDNISRKISAYYAQVMRRYTLFAKPLLA
ncbi:MAG: GNAT family N-acetyltransferase [Caldilineaceae bacterium]